MLGTIGSMAQGLGAAFLFSDLGAAELIVGLLVAAGLLASVAQGRDHETHHHERAHHRIWHR